MKGLKKMEEKPLSHRQRQAMHTRQKLLEAGYAVFLEQGFQKATISQIIKRAETGYGTAYVYFQNKDELFAEVMDDVMKRFYEVAEFPFDPRTSGEAYALIAHQVRCFLELALKEKGIMRVVKEGIGSSPLVEKRWRQIRERFIKRIAQDIQYVQTKGLAKKELDPFLVARGWFYANEMFMWHLVEEDDPPALEDVIANLTAIYTGGLYHDAP
jgi:AcrR family transcriptional regulator